MFHSTLLDPEIEFFLQGSLAVINDYIDKPLHIT